MTGAVHVMPDGRIKEISHIKFVGNSAQKQQDFIDELKKKYGLKQSDRDLYEGYDGGLPHKDYVGICNNTIAVFHEDGVMEIIYDEEYTTWRYHN